MAEGKKYGAPQAPVSLMALLLLGLWLVNGAPASPEGFRYKQPDGSRTPMLYLRGDETYHYMTDSDGYAVIRDEDSGGWYVYAKLGSDGHLVSSGGRVGHVRPKKVGIVPGLRPHASTRRPAETNFDSASNHREMQSSGENSCKTKKPCPEGKPCFLKTLIVLIRFSDHVNRQLPSHTDMEILFNEPGGHTELAPTGSLRDVWLKNSHGLVDVDATATQWITLPHTEKFYANDNWGWRDEHTRQAFYFALRHIDENTDINLQEFDQDKDGCLDAVSFVHSGVASERGGEDCETGNAEKQRIWSHQSAGGSWASRDGRVQLASYFVASAIWPINWDPPCTFDMNRVGVFAHESGHHLGLPDLYDGDEENAGKGDGIGKFDFMANMWGWDGTARNPPHLSPWSKLELGFVKKVYLDRAKEYELEASIDIDEVYVIDHNFPNDEYLIVENRFAKDFDAAIPGGGGLAIYHIDRKASHRSPGFPGQDGWPDSGRHYLNALLPADGRYDLERPNDNEGDGTDLFRAGVGGVANAIGPNGINLDNKPHPNTNAYQDGNIRETGIVIRDISQSGPKMTFRLEGGGLPDPREINININPDTVPDCEDDDTFRRKGTRVCRRARRKIEEKGVKKVCKKSFVKNNCKKSCLQC